jgi:phosphoketolase
MNSNAFTPELLRKLDAWWRPANYLSVGQIYLYDNPLLKKPLKPVHIKPRPLATSWQSNKFLNPVHDGAVLPIVHLNGYKIASPCVLARIGHEELDQLTRGCGYTPHFVEGDDPMKMHQLMAGALDQAVAEIKRIQTAARKDGVSGRPRWPMIILRSPKGWTGPKVVDDKRTEGSWRSHHVPMGETAEPGHVKILERWMKSYQPEKLFDKSGRLKPELAELASKGERRMSANPHANGGLLLRDLRLRDFRCMRPSGQPSSGSKHGQRHQFVESRGGRLGVRDCAETYPGGKDGQPVFAIRSERRPTQTGLAATYR